MRESDRNRRVAAWLGAAILTLCIAVAIAKTQDSSVKRFPRIEFGEVATVCWPSGLAERTALPAVPQALNVYKVQSIPSRKALMLSLFRALPIPSTPKNKAAMDRLARMPESPLPKDTPLCEEIGGWEIEVSPDGRFRAGNSLRLSPSESKLAPPEAQVRTAADAFLSPIRPLLPSGVRFSAVQTREATREVVQDRVVDRVTMRFASYRADLDGIPVDAGASVDVVEGAEVVAVGSSLRRVAADRKVPILSPKEALRKVRAHEAHLDDGEGGIGYIDSIRLVYCNKGTGENNKLAYVMPIYVFAGETVYENKATNRIRRGRWKAFVEAVRPEFLQ